MSAAGKLGTGGVEVLWPRVRERETLMAGDWFFLYALSPAALACIVFCRRRRETV